MGTVSISLTISKDTPCIFIHNKGLNFSEIVLSSSSGDPAIQKIKGNSMPAQEFLEDTAKITFPVPLLKVGNYVLDIAFEGDIKKDNKGFYRCRDPRFPDDEKTTEEVAMKNSILTTTFEPVFAREAFPCFDEPSLKSVFELSVFVEDHDKIAISNMPIKTITPKIGTTGSIYEFEATPLMSSYLLVWVIGMFEFCETISNDGVLIRVYMPVGLKSKGNYAMDLAAKCVDFYSKYFGIPYPLKKLDLVSIHRKDFHK